MEVVVPDMYQVHFLMQQLMQETPHLPQFLEEQKQDIVVMVMQE